ncbi:MAG TPA: flagellar FlbD family protein [Actinomycetes bacterium]|jgi:flagellar protein FlbD|nr:flagellar FlbD family protein [Actinomycetes bacterium]
MIVVTRFHGSAMALNCDLIERAEATPDTVVTLVDGRRYVIQESVDEVVQKVREFRASVVVLAHHLDLAPAACPPGQQRGGHGPALHAVPDPDA